MKLKVKKRKTTPFPNAVTKDNKSGIIATVGQFYIILAKNIIKFAHSNQMRQKKRKLFLNFFTKTCTKITNDVAQFPKLSGACGRS